MRHLVLLLSIGALIAVMLTLPPIPQPDSYHAFADGRRVLAVPNAADVLSNAAFAVVGLLGLAAVRRARSTFADDRERWPYVAFFVGTLLTAFGSAYYHVAPDKARLFWDRLPMTVGFAGLLTAVLAERVGNRPARRLFVPLLLLGAGSVVYWYWTETISGGDLRPYLLVQFGSLILVVLMLVLYSGRYGGTGYLVAGLTLYAVAKLLEIADPDVFALGQIVSGHTLKHLAAAAGIGCVVAMLRRRTDDSASRTS